jgi:hypothetical protein
MGNTKGTRKMRERHQDARDLRPAKSAGLVALNSRPGGAYAPA